MVVQAANDKIFDVLSTDGAGLVVLDPPKFDIDSYIQNYSGRTRLERLLFIGQHSVSLCIDALKGAIAEARTIKDVGAYKAAQELLALCAPSEAEARLDKEWVDRTTKENATKSKRLEDELKGYKNNLIKESIRMGNDELGMHYKEIGEFEKAYESFNRMKQDMLMQKHIIDTSKRMISISILQEKWVMVQSHVQKIMAMPQAGEDEKVIQPYLKISLGLAHLAEGNFSDAAGCFLAVDSGMGSTYNDTVSSNDVAVYGGLCALATMDRNELQRRVLDNSKFRTYLELEPHIRRAVQQFVNGRYSACLSTLENYRNDYLLDIYLQKHITEIYYLIRSKSIIQYFIPFSCVTLDSMDEAFGSPGRSVEEELINMIQRNVLKARIDKHNRLLVSVPSQSRADIQRDTLASTRAYEQEMRQRIQRMNIIGANLEVRPAKKPQAGPTREQLQSMGMLDAFDGPGRRAGGGEQSASALFANDSGYE